MGSLVWLGQAWSLLLPLEGRAALPAGTGRWGCLTPDQAASKAEPRTRASPRSMRGHSRPWQWMALLALSEAQLGTSSFLIF